LAAPIKPPALVPSLDEVARNPHCVAGMPQSTVRDLLRRLAVAQSILVVELTHEDGSRQPETSGPAEEDRMLTAKEAAELLRRSPRWLYRNRKKLSFVRQLSARSFLCSERAIKQWLDRRARLPG
jgi:predicted DNA-binding transcriptional regulator AlpA